MNTTASDWAAWLGAATGIAGLIISVISYKKTNSLKSLDLRLELRRAVNDVRSTVSALRGQIEQANKSREAVAIASGNFGSGRMEMWKQQVAADRAAVQQLSQAVPPENESFESLKTQDLESKLVNVHRLQTQADQLKEKYEATVRQDDEQRKFIREAIERMNRPPTSSF